MKYYIKYSLEEEIYWNILNPLPRNIVYLRINNDNIYNTKEFNLNFQDLTQLKILNISYVFIKLSNIPTDNLEELTLVNTHLTYFDISKFKKLKILNLGSNKMTNFNINNVNNLEELYLEGNYLIDLNTKFLTNLKILDLNFNKRFRSLDTKLLTKLKMLKISFTDMTSLDTNSLINLEELDIYTDEIIKFDTLSLKKLKMLNISAHTLTNLNVNNLINLTKLNISNFYPEILTSKLNNLKILNIVSSLTPNINLSENNLEELHILIILK